MIIIRTNAPEVARWLQEKVRNMPKATREAAKEIERETLRDLRRTVSTWHHQPAFETVFADRDGGGFEMLIGTDDRVWNMLNVGTPPHYIFPVRKRALAFQTGYKAKTVPGVLGATTGGATGGTVVRAWVLHPGTRPRNWTEAESKELEKRVPDVLGRAVERWAR